MSAPRISVIIPVYNAKKTLSACIESIIRHQDPAIEILLIDDGSTDGSAAICDICDNRDSRIRVYHRENQGVSAARNFGLSEARGEWIAFIDSDDTIDPDYFPLDKEHNSDLLIQNWKFVGREDYLEHFEAAIYQGDEFRRFLSENAHLDAFRVVWGKFLRRDIIERFHLRFDTRIHLGEDTLFILSYLSHCQSVEVLGTSLYHYYRPANWSIDKYHISPEDNIYYMESFWPLYESMGIDSPRLVNFIFNFFLRRTSGNDRLWTRIRLNSHPFVMKMQALYCPNQGLKHLVCLFFSKILY